MRSWKTLSMVMTGDIEVQLWCGAYALFFAPEGEGGNPDLFDLPDRD